MVWLKSLKNLDEWRNKWHVLDNKSLIYLPYYYTCHWERFSSLSTHMIAMQVTWLIWVDLFQEDENFQIISFECIDPFNPKWLPLNLCKCAPTRWTVAGNPHTLEQKIHTLTRLPEHGDTQHEYTQQLIYSLVFKCFSTLFLTWHIRSWLSKQGLPDHPVGTHHCHHFYIFASSVSIGIVLL